MFMTKDAHDTNFHYVQPRMHLLYTAIVRYVLGAFCIYFIGSIIKVMMKILKVLYKCSLFSSHWSVVYVGSTEIKSQGRTVNQLVQKGVINEQRLHPFQYYW